MQKDDEFMRSEIEFDMDSQNPYEFRVIVKSTKPMTGDDVVDAIEHLLNDMIKPDIDSQKKKEDISWM